MRGMTVEGRDQAAEPPQRLSAGCSMFQPTDVQDGVREHPSGSNLYDNVYTISLLTSIGTTVVRTNIKE